MSVTVVDNGRAAAPWIDLGAGLVALAVVAAVRLWPRFSQWRWRRREAYLASEAFAFSQAIAALRARDFGDAVRSVELWWSRLPPAAGVAHTRLSDALAHLGAALFGRDRRPPLDSQWSDAVEALRAMRRARLAATTVDRALPACQPAAGGMMVLLFRLLAAFGLLVLGTAPGMAQTPGIAPGHVGSQTCSSCHESEGQGWKGSHHAWAWTQPDETTVLGDFDDAVFEHRGVTTHFTRHDGLYSVETEGSDGALHTFRVAGVVGVAPLQQYLVATQAGRLQALDIVKTSRLATGSTGPVPTMSISVEH